MMFTGTVLRIEPDGFGIVQFDAPIGPSANAYGVFSTSLGSTAPYAKLKSGVRVTGKAKPELGDRKVATIEVLRIAERVTVPMFQLDPGFLSMKHWIVNA